MRLPGDEFQGTERFVVRRRIGSGGMGAVYEAYDRERNETVALKTLRWRDPTAIYRLKKEFRSLSDVAHPNLVSLYELVAEGDDWFYTMELVDGVDFLTYVRPVSAHARPPALDAGTRPASPPPDVERLRQTVRQLAGGVAALHRAGILHRDLKPSNVLVTPAGRVVILDFGLAAVVGSGPSVRTAEEGLWGTVAYMAPEQSAGEYGPASDWYTVGVMLHEALTGQLPFDGTTPEILVAKAQREAPPAREVVAGLPRDLADLSHALLARRVGRRPGDEQVLRRLGALEWEAAPAAVAGPPGHPTVLIGRDDELARLEDAFAAACAGSGVALYVYGPSGIGKSALVRCFTGGLEGDGRALVLSGRCYERESVPYKALDGVVDHLSRHLRSLPSAEVGPLVPADVAALTRLFPVLSRVEAFARMPSPEREVSDPLELRRLAFGALRELFSRLSARRPLVVCIDDLQWADLDSTALLEDLMRPPDAPAMLMVACFRAEDLESQTFLGPLLARTGTPTCRRCAVGPLSPAHAARLAADLLGADATGSAAAVTREAAGSPFLVEQLVRYVLDSRDAGGAAAVGLADMLDARIRTLPDGARPLLDTLALAGRPVDAQVAHAAASLVGDERPLVTSLIKAHFLRSAGVPPRLELYHDRMRETLAARLSREEAARIHLRLATCSEQRGFDDPEALFEHYLAAGERARAAKDAARAATKALTALAFDRAAAFFERALELAPPAGANVNALRAGLGDALASAGRCPAAAEAYLAAARDASPAAALEYRRRAAEQLLISGHLPEGLAVIRTVLRTVGLALAPTPRRALLSLLLRRARLRLRGLGFRERAAAEVPATELTRIDTCWAVAVGLGLVDNIRAADFQTQHLLLALRAGDPQRIARALAIEAGFMATRGRPARRRTRQLLGAARELAERIRSEHALALCSLIAGIAAYHEGEWEHARDHAEEAERLLLGYSGGGVPWELSTAQIYQAYACYHLGDLPELARRGRRFLSRARERGNLFAAFFFRSGPSNLVWLGEDDASGAQQALDDALAEWHQEGFGIPHYLAMWAQAHIDLYVGKPEAAWAVVGERWSRFRGSMLPRIQGIRINATNLRARCALGAAAGASGRERRRLLASAAHDARRLEREQLPWSDALARLLHAGVAAGGGALAEVVPRLRHGVAGLEAARMGLYAATARRRLGEALGGEEGRSLVAAADAAMRAIGVRDPAAIATVFAPMPFPPRSGGHA
jgi:serine/threonine protein kinase/tetratricopeptide (TPR) repeat protein